MSTTVFISSTRKDLKPYVDAVDAALRRGRFEPILNEYWLPRPGDTVRACEDEVRQADLFVGIYGWRYGHVPPGDNLSITEQELRAAEEAERPIFRFLVKDGIPPPKEFSEEVDDAQRMAQFKERLRAGRIVGEFTTPDNLALQVFMALEKELDRDDKLSGRRLILLRLLKSAQSSWIEPLLAKKVPKGRRIRIRWQERPEAVGGLPIGESSSLDPTLRLKDLFHGKNRKLLILGAHGAGKSVTLLELARELGQRAEGDPRAPIPVVFQLGSWSKGVDLVEWMTGELFAQFKAEKHDAGDWIKHDLILPLLDGLDEVEPNLRRECVREINTYLNSRGHRIEMAVCCETKVYDALPQQLRLLWAIALLPLTHQQVDDHLVGGGPALEELRAAIGSRPALLELLSSPLALAGLEQTYRPGGLAELEAGGLDAIFARRVAHALEPEVELPLASDKTPIRLDWLPWRRRRPKPEVPRRSWKRRYTAKRSRRALAWLARQTVAHKAPLFQVERLQPAWLESNWEVWAYALISRALSGLVIALPVAWIYESATLLLGGLLAGALAGGVDALWLQRRTSASTGVLRWLRRPLGRGIIVSVGVCGPLLVGGTLWRAFFPSGREPGEDFGTLLLACLFFAPLYGLIFGSRGAVRDLNRDVRVRPAFVWKRWSRRFSLLAGTWGALAGLALGARGALDPELSYIPDYLWPLLALPLFLIGSLVGGLVGGIVGKPLEKHLWPNQGTWRTMGNAVIVTLCLYLPAILVLAPFLVISSFFRGGPEEGLRQQDLLDAARGGLAVAIWAGLWFSGLDIIHHLTLRAVLFVRGRLPARLVGFLEYAGERDLLHRGGGSYAFAHPLLRAYLARSAGTE